VSALETGSSPLPSFPIDIGSIRSLLEYRFTILDWYIDVNGLPTFVVAQEQIKLKFQELLADLRNHSLSARVVKVSDKLVISVFPKRNLGKPRKLINLLMFLATIGAIGLAGYTAVFYADPRVTAALFPGGNLTVQAAAYAVSILGIIAIHEMGHVIANRHHKMDATLPYFVPGPPPIGTFGAVISLRGPPANRDQLFDLGFSGPIAGFMATIGVAIFAYFTAPIVTAQEAEALLKANLLSVSPWPYTPLLLDVFDRLGLRVVPADHVLVLTQLALAIEVGALITFLNLLPVWQLDGGHIARAIFGAKGHKIAALVGFMVLVIAGYWAENYWGFALLLIIFMIASRRPLDGVEPLDDISPLSASRKMLFACALVMLAFSFVAIRF